MTQSVHYWIDDTHLCRDLPSPTEELISGVTWGNAWQIFTPAYWLSQLWMSGLERAVRSPFHARGSLAEELTFCMLGGYGVTAELTTAAFDACRSIGLISDLETEPDKWEAELRKPLLVKNRSVHYRYPKQKARFLANAMSFLRANCLEDHTGRALRDALLKITGVGPKTAGWVVRNYLDADDVAILDIHLIRAGILCDLFPPEQHVERHYFEMEGRYIEFCRALNARPALLDCLIWDQMRTYGKVVKKALNLKLGISESDSSPNLETNQAEIIFA